MKWWQGTTECSICGHRQQSIIEIEEDQESPVVALECGNCGNFTCHPLEDEDELC